MTTRRLTRLTAVVTLLALLSGCIVHTRGGCGRRSAAPFFAAAAVGAAFASSCGR